MASKRKGMIALVVASGITGLASVSIIHGAKAGSQFQILEQNRVTILDDQSQEKIFSVSESKILVDVGDRATLHFPSGSRVLTERNIDQGGVSASNTVVEVPISLNEIMEFVEDTLRRAGQTPEVIRTDQVKAINITDIESGFRAGFAFEAISDESTVVVVSVFDRQ